MKKCPVFPSARSSNPFPCGSNPSARNALYIDGGLRHRARPLCPFRREKGIFLSLKADEAFLAGSPGQLRTLSLVAISMYPTRVRETTPLAIKDQSHPAQRVPLQQEGSGNPAAVAVAVAAATLPSSSRTLQLRRIPPFEATPRERMRETEPLRARWEI